MDDESKTGMIELTAELVAAYVARNALPAAELPTLMKSVHDALNGLSSGKVEEIAEPVELKPAVSVRKSVSDDAITCLDCGKRFKSLKRHLSAEHGLDPASYRGKWSLAKDYPMVAPAYAQARSSLAKTLGLGRKAFVATAEPVNETPKKGRGRPAKAA